MTPWTSLRSSSPSTDWSDRVLRSQGQGEQEAEKGEEEQDAQSEGNSQGQSWPGWQEVEGRHLQHAVWSSSVRTRTHKFIFSDVAVLLSLDCKIFLFGISISVVK